MDARHSVLESGLGAFISLNFDIDSLCMDTLRAERKAGPVRRLVGIAMDAPNGSLLLAEKPFISTGADSSVASQPLVEVILQQSDLSHCLGSQAWSPRYRHQRATAVLVEPLASAETTTVVLADGSTAQASICSLPFDFEKPGISAHA